MLSKRKREGLEILYDNYSAALYGVIHRIIGDDDAAEDVLRETFLEIWNTFSKYDSHKGRLFSWTLHVARKLAIDKVRSGSFTTQELKENVNETSNDGFDSETIGLKETIKMLQPEYKEIIDMLFYGGYSQSETAEKLSIPLGTVKTRLRVAIARLRQLFELVNA